MVIAFALLDSWEQIVKTVRYSNDRKCSIWRNKFFCSVLSKTVCPEGYYGQHCLGECACPNNKFVCHAAHGCICRQGFTGEDCSKSKHDAQEQVKEDSNSAGVAWGVTLSLLFVAVIVFVIMYYRRHIRGLKATIADVEYHANPQLQPDRHHFDNPVYAFQPSTSQPNSDSSTLLNNLRSSHKPSNLGRGKIWNDFTNAFGYFVQKKFF